MQKLQEEISALQRQQQALDARHGVQQQKLVDSTLASERAQELLKDRFSEYGFVLLNHVLHVNQHNFAMQCFYPYDVGWTYSTIKYAA